MDLLTQRACRAGKTLGDRVGVHRFHAI